MLCGFGTDLTGGRLPFVLHPAVLPKLQSIAQRLGLPTPIGVEPPSPISGLGASSSSTPQMINSPPSATPLLGLEPLLLSAMASSLQASMPSFDQQQQQLNPAAKAFLALLLQQQQQQIRQQLFPSLSLVDTNNSSPSTSEQTTAAPMDFSPMISPAFDQHSSSEASPADMSMANRANSKAPSSFLPPSSSSSPVNDAASLMKTGSCGGHRHHQERTPSSHRRIGNNSSNLLSGENGMIVHGEPIECLPAYAKLANARWSHKQATALQRQQQCSNNNNNSSSALNNSDDMTVGPSPNSNTANPNNQPDNASPTSGCMHVCIFCGKRYSRKYGLKIHLRTHTGYRPLECRYCHRRFGDPSNLNKHLRLHAQVESPFVCKFCGKSLVRRRDLDRHLRSRHPGMVVPTTAVSPAASSTPAAVMTPVSLVATPSSRQQPIQQQRTSRLGNNNVETIVSRQHIGNTMVFPSRGQSPPHSSNSPPTSGSISQ